MQKKGDPPPPCFEQDEPPRGRQPLPPGAGPGAGGGGGGVVSSRVTVSRMQNGLAKGKCHLISKNQVPVGWEQFC